MCPHCCGEILSLLNFLISNLNDEVFSYTTVRNITLNWIEEIKEKYASEKTVS